MITLLLISALVGPVQYEPPKDSDRVVLVNLADRMADHAFWIGTSASADLFTTGWALHSCPTCYESNSLTPNAQTQVAIKAAAFLAVMGVEWKLEKEGKSKTAKIIRWVYFGVFSGLAVNNSIHAIRKK